jgi:hypothetical protein
MKEQVSCSTKIINNILLYLCFLQTQIDRMKKLKTIAIIACIAAYSACTNPNSSTSQEPSDDKGGEIHNTGGHDNMQHEKEGNDTRVFHSDSVPSKPQQ